MCNVIARAYERSVSGEKAAPRYNRNRLLHAPRPPAPRSTPLRRFSATPAHRSAPPDCWPALLRFPLRYRSAHMLWSLQIQNAPLQLGILIHYHVSRPLYEINSDRC